MLKFSAQLIFVLALFLQPALSWANELDDFFDKLVTLQAEFVQKSENGKLTGEQTLSGTLYIERPGKFRWDYQKPYKQLIISDGKKVWLYDVDLEQVTIKALDATIGDTPAMLLSSEGSLKNSFIIKNHPSEEGLDWVKLLPRKQDASFNEIRIGFKNNQINTMVLVDNLEQITRISFSKIQRNPKLTGNLFSFKVPDGVDVIDDSAPRK
ncbi:MAG: outer membrane lipoprotein chaperone LolA [Gammaproteobacteria bacterium]|nr:outer membrane lipoprotein chaperone LolA [Gammaproteobacteria bacterium]MDH5694652.1 outer membrane lipoprotein chaperone LolA [Gammaproteobacteria bacterium]